MNYVSYRDKEHIYNVCTEYNMLSGNLPVSDLLLHFSCSSPSQSKSGFYGIASQMKLLVDTPEKVLLGLKFFLMVSL